MKTRSDITKKILSYRKPISFIDLDVIDKLLKSVRFNDQDCWIRGNDSTIYTYIRVYGESRLSHRFSYEIFTGNKLKYCACHKCDVKACINPDHIFDGTDSDNSRDARIKHRVFSLQFGKYNSKGHESIFELEGRLRKLSGK